VAKICMVGTGYVGLVSGACFADFGHEVLCLDINQARIDALSAGEIPFYEPGLDRLVLKNAAAGRLRFGVDLAEGVRFAEALFIAVQTPSAPSGEADLQHVFGVARQIGALLVPGQYRLVVTKSTVPVGTARLLRDALAASASPGTEFDVASNPEFLREGSSIEDFMRPDRIVIGSDSERALALLRELYRPLYLLDTPVVATSLESAELIKYASNSFLAVKISFINEISNLCEKVGADVAVVAKAMGLDRRIGPKFLHAGLGFGGSCLPKDTRAIVHMGQRAGESMRIIQSAVDVNVERPQRVLEKLTSALGSVEGKTIAAIGLAFKPNTDDIREAPSLAILRLLRERGAKLRGCDPQAAQRVAAEIEGMIVAVDAYDCVESADAALLLTEWNEYRELDLERVKQSMRRAVFIDCRNVYPRARMEALGFHYDSFGR
jgi:UDPglucose 6-dehydrogenase